AKSECSGRLASAPGKCNSAVSLLTAPRRRTFLGQSSPPGRCPPRQLASHADVRPDAGGNLGYTGLDGRRTEVPGHAPVARNAPVGVVSQWAQGPEFSLWATETSPRR